MHKDIPVTPDHNFSASSNNILKQLQQNESLRTQVYKLKTQIKSQFSKHQNTLTSQQMITQKLITSLKMAIRSQISQRKEQTFQQSYQILCGTIQKCLYDLQNLFELLDCAKTECERQIKQKQLFSLSESTKSDQSPKMNRNCQNFQDNIKQRDFSNKKYQNCLKQNQQLKRKVVQMFEQMKNNKLNMNKLLQTINEQKLNIKLQQYQIKKLSDENDSVVAKIKENQLVSRKHVDYFKKKSEQIQQQNKKLIQLHRDSVFRQKELIKIVEESQKQIQKLLEQGIRLKTEMQAFQLKMNEIIQKQQKIKQLEILIRNKPLQVKSIKQIKQKENIKTLVEQSNNQQTRKMKKFNLQFFQQKLCSSTNSLVY